MLCLLSYTGYDVEGSVRTGPDYTGRRRTGQGPETQAPPSTTTPRGDALFDRAFLLCGSRVRRVPVVKQHQI